MVQCRMDLMSLKWCVAAQDRQQVVDALLGEAGTSGRENYALRDPRLFPRFCVFFWSFEPVN